MTVLFHFSTACTVYVVQYLGVSKEAGLGKIYKVKIIIKHIITVSNKRVEGSL